MHNPLHNWLYAELVHHFGSVTIANQGEPFKADVVKSPVTGRETEQVLWPGEYYRVNCMFCNDTRKRLWISHMFGVPFRGHPRIFLAHCFNESCMGVPGNARKLYDKLYTFYNRNYRPLIPTPEPVDQTPVVMKLPGECVPLQDLPPSHHAVQYLVGERGYPLSVAAYYKASYCVQYDPHWHPNPKMYDCVRLAHQRIIIPVYVKGALVGWQARYIGKPPEKSPKYFTAPGMRHGGLFYNQDNVADKHFAIVCEGPLDVWRVGDYAMAMLSNQFGYHKQQELIRLCRTKPVIFLLEEEGREKILGTLRHMKDVLGMNVASYGFAKGQDPGFFSTEAIWNIIQTTANQAGMRL